MTISTVGIIGTGAWGTTFAQVLADAGCEVCLWGRNAHVLADLNSGHNERYLPGVKLSGKIHASSDLSAVIGGCDLMVVALPTQVIRPVLSKCARQIRSRDLPVLTLSKGIEVGTSLLVTQVVTATTGIDSQRVAALSGPNLSGEIIAKHPTATVIATADDALARDLVQSCHNDYFRPYVSRDVIGCEVAGAAKNVIALAVGAAEGMGLGINTRATLITRGLAEITRLGTRLGADPETFAGLAGMGDLVATCSSHASRNYAFGLRLGRGMSIAEATRRSAGVVEGARTAAPLVEFAHSLGVQMPIAEAVAAVIGGRASVSGMGTALLSRPAKMDGWRLQEL